MKSALLNKFWVCSVNVVVSTDTSLSAAPETTLFSTLFTTLILQSSFRFLASFTCSSAVLIRHSTCPLDVSAAFSQSVSDIHAAGFLSQSVSSEVFNDFDLSSYTALVRASVLASGLIFELPILIYFLTKVGLVTPELMRKYRKISLVLVMFLSAVITPPDVASQIIVAIPVLILYELSIFISKRVIKNMTKKKKN